MAMPAMVTVVMYRMDVVMMAVDPKLAMVMVAAVVAESIAMVRVGDVVAETAAVAFVGAAEAKGKDGGVDGPGPWGGCLTLFGCVT